MKLILLAISLTTVFGASAQTATLSGRVVSQGDSTALAGATVVLSDDMQRYAVSNEEGRFVISGVPYGDHSLQFSYLGFKPHNKTVTVKEASINLGDIFLSEAVSRISAVIVKAPIIPVSIRNDTVQYNADAFKTNPDADVEELIVKMPGVIIQQGKIEAQGEPVRRIYVDGKLFFGTDPMAALKSLPADAVESIQLFDAPSEESRMTGLDDGNTEKAINIVTKTKAGESTIVKAEISGGRNASSQEMSPFRYLAGGNFSRFTEKQRFTVSLLSNNVNTQKFGDPELSGDQEVDANGNLRNQPMGIQDITGAGVNYTREGAKLKIESSYFYDRKETDITSRSELNYFPDPDPDPENPDPKKFDQKSTLTENSYLTVNSNHRFNARLEWKPSKTNTLVFNPQATYRSNELQPHGTFQQNMRNNVPTNRSRTYSPSESENLYMSGNLYWTHRFAKRGRSLSASLQYTLNDRDQSQYQVDSMRQRYNAGDQVWEDMKDNQYRNRYITNPVSTSSVRGRLSWSEPIATYHRVVASYTYRYEWSDYDRRMFDLSKETADYTNELIAQASSYMRNYTTNSAGLGYSLYKRTLSLNSEMSLQHALQSRSERMPNQADTEATFVNLEPTVSLKYSIQKKRYLRVRYTGRTVLPDIQRMQTVLNTTRPSFLQRGNPNLREGYRHMLEAFYNTTDVSRATNLTLMLRGTAISNYVANKNVILAANTELDVIENNPEAGKYTAEEGAMLTTPENMDGYVMANAAATYSFTLRPIKSNINLSGTYGHTRVPSYFRDTPNMAVTNSIGGRVGITSNVSRNVDFNIYSTTTYNDTDNSAREDNSFLNQNFFYSVNIIFWKGFVFNSVLSWRSYYSSSASELNDSYYVLNASLGKKVFRNRSGEVRLSVYDMLDQNSNPLHYVRDAYVQDQVTNTLGRYVLLRFSYRFNSMTMARKGAPDLTNARSIDIKELRKIQGKQQPAGGGKSAAKP